MQAINEWALSGWEFAAWIRIEHDLRESCGARWRVAWILVHMSPQEDIKNFAHLFKVIIALCQLKWTTQREILIRARSDIVVEPTLPVRIGCTFVSDHDIVGSAVPCDARVSDAVGARINQCAKRFSIAQERQRARAIRVDRVEHLGRIWIAAILCGCHSLHREEGWLRTNVATKDVHECSAWPEAALGSNAVACVAVRIIGSKDRHRIALILIIWSRQWRDAVPFSTHVAHVACR